MGVRRGGYWGYLAAPAARLSLTHNGSRADKFAVMHKQFSIERCVRMSS